MKLEAEGLAEVAKVWQNLAEKIMLLNLTIYRVKYTYAQSMAVMPLQMRL